MIIPHYYEDPHTLHVGTMPNRAYYIPASRRSDALVEHRETSDRFQLLNGSWKFRYYASIYDLQDAFYEVGYDASAFDSIPVPSVWQNHGYDHHQYTNIRYPFPADPPYVPKENPCGAYLYDFTYQKDAAAPRAFLNFEGVASCFYVWLNGQFVGYSQVAHSTSEFDVTKFLQNGTNHLAVLVLKWCDGSYMEDQDMFRMNGIFRDVYLLHRPEQCIEDYFITTDIHGSTAEVAVRLRYYDSAVATRITLYDAAGTMVGSVTPVEASDDAAFPYHAEITVVDPTLWNAEQPYLYTLVLDTPNEIITDRVGIREVHVANNQIYVNGQSIKFHGVNRHESDPVTGYAVGFEQTKKDLLMIKKHNFNAIRTSHYPDVPYFYQLCDQYGFFVIDEADNESHGASEYYCEGNESWPNHVENWNKPIADNPEFTEATVDRTRRCVERDKNRPCVIIWSMGNESAYGCTFEEALAWTKSFDPRRLTHYESAQYRSKNRKYDFSNIDMFSNMYPSLESIQEYLDNEPDNDGDNQEGEDDAGDGGNGGHAALQFDGTSNAGKHSNGNSAGFGSGAELIRGGGQHQHLDGAVVFQGIPVVFQADLDGFASAKEFRAVFGCNGDDGDHGKDGGHNGGHHPEFMEELGRGIVANISILVGNVGNDNSQHRKQDGIEHAIERSEHGALFGIVGHAALGALGNNALAGVAQVINAAEHNKENKAGGAFRQFVGKVEHDKAGSRQNDVANDHERAVFAELAVGFIHHVANERVSYAVPDTHSHGKAGCHDHTNANKAQ